MVSYRNTLYSGVIILASLFSVNQEWWLKQKRTKIRGKDFFLLAVGKFCFSLPPSFNSWVNCCMCWPRAPHTHTVFCWEIPISLLLICTTQCSGRIWSSLTWRRNPHSREGENHWRWMLTSVGWAMAAENDWCVEPTLGLSGKLIHFLFTL